MTPQREYTTEVVKSKEQATAYLKNHEPELILAGNESSFENEKYKSKIIRFDSGETDQGGVVSLAADFFEGNQ